MKKTRELEQERKCEAASPALNDRRLSPAPGARRIRHPRFRAQRRTSAGRRRSAQALRRRTAPAAAPAPQAKANVGVTGEEPFSVRASMGAKITQQGTKQGVCAAPSRPPHHRRAIGLPHVREHAGGQDERRIISGRTSSAIRPATRAGRPDPMENVSRSIGRGFLNKLASLRAYSWRAGPVNGQILEGRVNFNQSTAQSSQRTSSLD